MWLNPEQTGKYSVDRAPAGANRRGNLPTSGSMPGAAGRSGWGGPVRWKSKRRADCNFRSTNLWRHLPSAKTSILSLARSPGAKGWGNGSARRRSSFPFHGTLSFPKGVLLPAPAGQDPIAVGARCGGEVRPGRRCRGHLPCGGRSRPRPPRGQRHPGSQLGSGGKSAEPLVWLQGLPD